MANEIRNNGERVMALIEYDSYKQKLRELGPELEKLAGKKQFAAICGEYIEKPQGKPTLAPESDKRAAINPMLGDFKNIG